MRGPEKWQKWGRAKRDLSRFCLVVKKGHGHFGIAPLSLNLFQEIFFEFHLVYSQSMSDRFSAHCNSMPLVRLGLTMRVMVSVRIS